MKKSSARPASLAGASGSPRCEGYRRYGGAFTLGPVRWEQCKDAATVMLKLKQDGKVQTLPACPVCWAEAKEHEIKVLSAEPIVANTKPGDA